MGVFSVTEKDRYHNSNIYSGAPMPYMQRITWSGVALHEGVLPGHPASHGCIRMSHDFAMRLWPITKLGVRVIVARDELTPAEFAHAKLFVPRSKPEPQTAMNVATEGATQPTANLAAATIAHPDRVPRNRRSRSFTGSRRRPRRKRSIASTCRRKQSIVSATPGSGFIAGGLRRGLGPRNRTRH